MERRYGKSAVVEALVAAAAATQLQGKRPSTVIVDDVTAAQEKLLEQIIKKHSATVTVHRTDSRTKRSKGDKHRDKASRWHG